MLLYDMVSIRDRNESIQSQLKQFQAYYNRCPPGGVHTPEGCHVNKSTPVALRLFNLDTKPTYRRCAFYLLEQALYNTGLVAKMHTDLYEKMEKMNERNRQVLNNELQDMADMVLQTRDLLNDFTMMGKNHLNGFESTHLLFQKPSLEMIPAWNS